MRVVTLLIACSFFCVFGRAEEPRITVSLSQPAGHFRPLYGINKGPLVAGGLIDLSEEHRRIGIPFVRLHDCHWPNPDVVDIHVLFPDFAGDPSNPASYDFRMTDEYLAAIRQTGAQIIFRLGESIEHTTFKRFVHPPADFEKWAAICEGVVRHYNEGWGNGFRWGIQYWEIWNEPDNKPAMWSGTDEDYFKLYAITARRLKTKWPDLKIGGPGLGHSGSILKGAFEAGDFLKRFLIFCRKESLPLDYLSWHCYTDDPREFLVRARGIRQLLDVEGFSTTESHLNEWNFLPNNDWKPVLKGSSALERQDFYRKMAGPAGAAFVAYTLLLLQDSPVDMANFFHGEIGGFGLFNEHGVPEQSYFAFRAFHELSQQQRLVVTNALSETLQIGAGMSHNRTEGAILMAYAPWIAKGLTNQIESKVVTLELQGLEPSAWNAALVEFRPDSGTRAEPVHLGKKGEIKIPLKEAGLYFIQLQQRK